jgi:hypothetical protein
MSWNRSVFYALKGGGFLNSTQKLNFSSVTSKFYSPVLSSTLQSSESTGSDFGNNFLINRQEK